MNPHSTGMRLQRNEAPHCAKEHKMTDDSPKYPATRETATAVSGSTTRSERLQLADAPELEQFDSDASFGVRRHVQSSDTDQLKTSEPQSRHRLDDRRLRRVLTYVDEHLAEDITVADLANVACLSIFHFTRAFAATMGVPPHRYVSQRRLESAKVMIATGRASLSEIALDCQFSSESSFTRAFRRAIGMTPAAYRRTLR